MAAASIVISIRGNRIISSSSISITAISSSSSQEWHLMLPRAAHAIQSSQGTSIHAMRGTRRLLIFFDAFLEDNYLPIQRVLVP